MQWKVQKAILCSVVVSTTIWYAGVQDGSILQWRE